MTAWPGGRADVFTLEGVILEASQRRHRRAGPEDSRPPCRSVAALLVERGRAAGVEVSGLAVAIAGERREAGGPLRRLVLLEERATPEQVRVLLDLVEGRLGGGILTTLAGSADRDLGVYQVPISSELAADAARVLVPGHLELRVGAASAEMVLDVPEHALSWHVAGCEALRGEIHVGGGASRARTSL